MTTSAIHAAAAPSWRIERADLVDGSVLQGVTISWTDDGARLHLARDDGAWKDIAPDELLRAMDANGDDLRDEIMAARPAGARNGGASEATGGYSEVGAAPAHARPVNLADAAGPVFHGVVSILPGWGATGGDWTYRLHSGFSLEGTVRLGVSSRSWLTLVARRQDAGGGEYTSYTLWEYSVMMGGPFVPIRGPRAMVTWDLGLGAVQKRETRAALSPQGGTIDITSSKGKLMIVAQIGALVPLGDRFVLDIRARAGTTPPFVADEDEPGGSVYALQAGIGWISW